MVKAGIVSSFFVLSVLATGIVATNPSAFADHPNAVLEPLPGSATAGCEQTDEGCYNMPILTVSPRTTITFSNTDNVAHTLTSGSPEEMTGAFDSGLVLAGATYEFTLDEEGTYDHYCVVHPWMTGQIIVDASAGQNAAAHTTANETEPRPTVPTKKQPEPERDNNVYEEYFIRHDHGGTNEIEFMPNGSFTYDFASHGYDDPDASHCMQALTLSLPCPEHTTWGAAYYIADHVLVAAIKSYSPHTSPMSPAAHIQQIILYDPDGLQKSETWFYENGTVRSNFLYDDYGNKKNEPVLWERFKTPMGAQPKVCADPEMPLAPVTDLWNTVFDKIGLEILTTTDPDDCNVDVNLGFLAGSDLGRARCLFDHCMVDIKGYLGSNITQGVLLHEMGHVFGLGHNNKKDSLMYSVYSPKSFSIDKATEEAILCIYKDGWEKSYDNIEACAAPAHVERPAANIPSEAPPGEEGGRPTGGTNMPGQQLPQPDAAGGDEMRTIHVGVLLPATGDLASHGNENKIALDLAVEDFNEYLAEKGADWRMNLVAEDTQSNPVIALEKVQSLNSRGIKYALGPESNAEIRNIKSYTDSNGMIILSPSSTSPRLAVADNIFRFVPDDTKQGKVVATLLADRGIKTAVPIYRGDVWGDGLFESTRESFTEMGGVVAEGIRYSPEITTFATEADVLSNMVEAELADYEDGEVGVFVIGFDEVVHLFNSAIEYDILNSVPWFGFDGNAGAAPLVEDGRSATFATNTGFVATQFAAFDNEVFEMLRADFKELAGSMPSSNYVFLSYDSLWVLGLSMEEVGFDALDIKEQLPKTGLSYTGALGTVRLNDAGDLAIADYDLWSVIEGEWVVTARYNAATGEIVETVMAGDKMEATEATEIRTVDVGVPLPATGDPASHGNEAAKAESVIEVPVAFVDASVDPQRYVHRYNTEEAFRAWFDTYYPEYLSIHHAVGLPEVPAAFVDELIDPQRYVHRYNTEEAFRAWFDTYYPEYPSIYYAVGLPEVPAAFVDASVDPQRYVHRYNTEEAFRAWFDTYYPEYPSIYHAVGLPDIVRSQQVEFELRVDFNDPNNEFDWNTHQCRTDGLTSPCMEMYYMGRMSVYDNYRPMLDLYYVDPHDSYNVGFGLAHDMPSDSTFVPRMIMTAGNGTNIEPVEVMHDEMRYLLTEGSYTWKIIEYSKFNGTINVIDLP